MVKREKKKRPWKKGKAEKTAIGKNGNRNKTAVGKTTKN
jgi:hypothetical protein